MGAIPSVVYARHSKLRRIARLGEKIDLLRQPAQLSFWLNSGRRTKGKRRGLIQTDPLPLFLDAIATQPANYHGEVHGRGRIAGARRCSRNRALTKDVETGLALVVALVLLVRSAPAAEGFPDPTLEQAKFFGRRGNVDAALRLCEESIPNVSAESAITVALAIARQGPKRLNPVQQQRILGWIDAVLAASPDRPAIRLLAADLKDLQGEYREVAAIYRDLLRDDSLSDQQRAIVLNNLAYLMAVGENNGDDALPLIEEAIQLVGPNAHLFDTRGTVWLARKALGGDSGFPTGGPSSGLAYQSVSSGGCAICSGTTSTARKRRSSRQSRWGWNPRTFRHSSEGITKRCETVFGWDLRNSTRPTSCTGVMY